jgi:hypothetical protein
LGTQDEIPEGDIASRSKRHQATADEQEEEWDQAPPKRTHYCRPTAAQTAGEGY